MNNIENNDKKLENKLKGILPYVAGILIVALILSNIFLLRFYLENSRKATFIVSENSRLEFTKLEMEAQFQKNLNELNSMRSENGDLNKIIELKIAELVATKTKLDQSNADESAIRAAMAQMNQQNTESIRLIQTLKTDNLALKDQIVVYKDRISIQEQNQGVLQQTIDSMFILSVQKDEKIGMMQEQVSTSSQTLKDLDAQIKNVSYISLKKLEIKPQNERAVLGTAEAKRANKVDYFNICFYPSLNPLLKGENQSFYFQIINANGEPVKTGNDVGKANGQPLRMVKSVEVANDRLVEQHCFTWKPETKLAKGKYTLRVFNNENLAGEESFTLK